MENREILIEVNGRRYRWPSRPVVAVCIDGCSPDYLENALAAGIMPNLAAFKKEGFFSWADGVIPSFTNPNNLSIVTGVPPSGHGISGNYYLDSQTGAEIMMNDPRLLRCETIPAKFAGAGARVAVVTAKDKLLGLLSHHLFTGIRFSAERADRCTLPGNGIEGVPSRVGMDLPQVYSPELSYFVLRAGVKILETHRPHLMYLSLTDFIQHKYSPGTAQAAEFYRLMDAEWGKLADLGAVVALTADHGMNDKTNPDGSPRVIYLLELLDLEFGGGACRVICPITDPYVAHHGSLGSFVTVFLFNRLALVPVMNFIRRLRGVERVVDRQQVFFEFELPPDRVGDLSVLGDASTVIGTSPRDHDLSALGHLPLRSHGGLAEQKVPFILSRPLSGAYARRAQTERLRNFHLFEFALNGTM
ncbi:MAG: phosphonoacetate hydrolase [Syntrophaceae bacterium]|nr:phosphonoacetate hydrolase [Syntrophaceae bacterium]